MTGETVFTRAGSAAAGIERMLQTTAASVDAALYRLNHPRLVQALADVAARGVRVRLVLDGGKFEQTRATRELLATSRFPFRLLSGRQGAGSKMHHKFAVLDGQIVLTGSYNWTVESEDENYENLIVLRGAPAAEAYAREFEALWAEAAPAPPS
jgi:phosphatidylserine/phosphatidylglycerophosphate/cardiolipin synthase-like enzyme